eukprot:TRINITY_DN3649_c1_g2_i6.p2 TRINITY_DN3649_c1_g2~~TRINITY_DN3649_c1_g2_i6.p2  ORF type:complete len:125 (-),score=12.69 TRINITY_DN3649_c1_g2_i6:79-453(-)
MAMWRKTLTGVGLVTLGVGVAWFSFFRADQAMTEEQEVAANRLDLATRIAHGIPMASTNDVEELRRTLRAAIDRDTEQEDLLTESMKASLAAEVSGFIVSRFGTTSTVEFVTWRKKQGQKRRYK